MQLTEEGALAAAQAVIKKPNIRQLELNENVLSAGGVRQLQVRAARVLPGEHVQPAGRACCAQGYCLAAREADFTSRPTLGADKLAGPPQAALEKAGKLSILGSLEDNEPQDGDDEDQLSDEDASKPLRPAVQAHQNGGAQPVSAMIEKLTAAVARTKLEDD